MESGIRLASHLIPVRDPKPTLGIFSTGVRNSLCKLLLPS
jgi:hypothetical protein